MEDTWLDANISIKVGKELPQQFPEPLLVGKLDVGNLAVSNTANTLQARNNLNYFQGSSS